MSAKKIYVGKFQDATSISEGQIREYFSQYGQVVEFQRPVDKSKNSEPKDFCFITFDTEEPVNQLLKKETLNIEGQEVFAREFKAKNLKRKKEEKSNFSAPEKKQKVIHNNSENFPVVQEIQKLTKNVIDLNRQISKPCIVFSGKDVKITTKLVEFKKNIKEKFYVDIKDHELSNFHPISKDKMIARFNVRHEESAYIQILKKSNTKNGRKNSNQKMQIFANLRLSEYDKSIAYFARKLKNMNKISFFDTDWTSGKIFIQMSDNKKKTLNTLQDLFTIFDDQTMEELKVFDTYGMLESNHMTYVKLEEEKDDLNSTETLLKMSGSSPSDV